jgi:hypothetical protein
LSDYLGISYRRTVSEYQSNQLTNWFWYNLREISSSASYSTHWVGQDVYVKGTLWASTLMDMEYNTATDPSQGTNF